MVGRSDNFFDVCLRHAGQVVLLLKNPLVDLGHLLVRLSDGHPRPKLERTDQGIFRLNCQLRYILLELGSRLVGMRCCVDCVDNSLPHGDAVVRVLSGSSHQDAAGGHRVLQNFQLAASLLNNRPVSILVVGVGQELGNREVVVED